MKRANILRSLVTILLLIGSIAFAKDIASEDILITTSNPDYIVSEVSIHRIASQNSPKILCQKLHWFLKPYWAPKEWYVNAKVENTAEGQFQTKAEANYHQNNLCGSSLISALKITINDINHDKNFNFETYLYTNGNETILLRATVTYDQGDWESAPSHKVTVDEVDRYISDDDSFIDVEIVDKTESE